MEFTKRLMDKAINLRSTGMVIDWDRTGRTGKPVEKIAVWFDKWTESKDKRGRILYKPAKDAKLFTANETDAENLGAECERIETFVPVIGERICWLRSELTDPELDEIASAKAVKHAAVSITEKVDALVKALESTLLKGLTKAQAIQVQREVSGKITTPLQRLTDRDYGKDKDSKKLSKAQIRQARIEQLMNQ